jgi:hypothetical protein
VENAEVETVLSEWVDCFRINMGFMYRVIIK